MDRSRTGPRRKNLTTLKPKPCGRRCGEFSFGLGPGARLYPCPSGINPLRQPRRFRETLRLRLETLFQPSSPRPSPARAVLETGTRLNSTCSFIRKLERSFPHTGTTHQQRSLCGGAGERGRSVRLYPRGGIFGGGPRGPNRGVCCRRAGGRAVHPCSWYSLTNDQLHFTRAATRNSYNGLLPKGRISKPIQLPVGVGKHVLHSLQESSSQAPCIRRDGDVSLNACAAGSMFITKFTYVFGFTHPAHLQIPLLESSASS